MMNGKQVKEYLGTLCSNLDEGRELRRSLGRKLGTLAIPAAVALGGTAGGCDLITGGDLYGAPPFPPPTSTEVCNDAVDNDGDGLVDCADDQCATDDACQSPVIPPTPTVYGAPPPGGDASPEPQQPNQGSPAPDPSNMVPEYGAPFPGKRPPTGTPPGATSPGEVDPGSTNGAYGAPFPGETPSGQ